MSPNKHQSMSSSHHPLLLPLPLPLPHISTSSHHTPLAAVSVPGKAQASQPTTQFVDIRPWRLLLSTKVAQRRTNLVSCRSSLNRIISAQPSSSNPHPSTSSTPRASPSTSHQSSNTHSLDSIHQNPIPVPANTGELLPQITMLKGVGWLPTLSSSNSHPTSYSDTRHEPQDAVVQPSNESPVQGSNASQSSLPQPSPTLLDTSKDKSAAIPQPPSLARPSSWFGFGRQLSDPTGKSHQHPKPTHFTQLPDNQDSHTCPSPAAPTMLSRSTSLSAIERPQDVTEESATDFTYPPTSTLKPQQASSSPCYPTMPAPDPTTLPTSESQTTHSDKPTARSVIHPNQTKQDTTPTRSDYPDGPPRSGSSEPASMGDVKPLQSDASISSDSRASWWGWGRPLDAEPQIPSSEPLIAPQNEASGFVDPSPSLLTQEIPSVSKHEERDSSKTYVSRVGSWVYSWYDNSGSLSSSPTDGPAPVSSQTSSFDVVEQPPSERRTKTMIDSIPNPISQSIPNNSRGWAGMFSTRRVIPGREVDEEQKSVENMEVEFNTSGAEDQGPSAGLSASQMPKSAPTSLFSRLPSLKRKNLTPSSSVNVPGGDGQAIDAEEAHRSFKEARPRVSFTSRYWGASVPSSQAQQNRISDSQPEPPKTEIHRPLTDSSLPPPKISIVNGKARATIPNLILPTFEDTFLHPPRSFASKSATSNPLRKTIGLVQAYIFSSPPTSPNSELDHNSHTRERRIRELFQRNNHISIRLPKSLEVLGIEKQDRLKGLRKVCVIGIHGWFPGPWLETVLGKPTGTSTKFAKMMGDSLQHYIEEHLGEALNREFMTLIPLEGDGKVDKRVDNLYKELYKRQDWVDSIYEADAIFVVTHSQGSIVSSKLLEKLIKMDGVRGEKVMLLCMCGIWNGPFMGLNSSYAFQPVLKLLEGPAAHELFEFQDPRSRASRSVLASLNFCLSSGVKMLLVASLNDQVVPLYSALYNSISHPSILRAVFIDSAVFYSTDFLTNLIVFCQRLRNAGLSDHGLQNHLSESVIGSLSGVGHSSVYEDRDVFDLAVRYFFETSSPFEPPTWVEEVVGGRSSQLKRTRLPLSLTLIDSSFCPKEKQNPFLLPWSLRGLMDDKLVQMLFGEDLERLRNEFEEWKPVTKVLKDLKLRLEPLKIDSTVNERQVVIGMTSEEEEERT